MREEPFIVSFTIPGRPVPAVRMTQKGKFTSRRAHRYLAYKDAVGWAFRNAYPGYGKPRDDLRFHVNVTVFVSKPESHSWDVDNVAKTVLDGLNNVVWKDDKQVDHLQISVGKAANKPAECVRVSLAGFPEGNYHEETGTVEGLSESRGSAAGAPDA